MNKIGGKKNVMFSSWINFSLKVIAHSGLLVASSFFFLFPFFGGTQYNFTTHFPKRVSERYFLDATFITPVSVVLNY